MAWYKCSLVHFLLYFLLTPPKKEEIWLGESFFISGNYFFIELITTSHICLVGYITQFSSTSAQGLKYNPKRAPFSSLSKRSWNALLSRPLIRDFHLAKNAQKLHAEVLRLAVA